MICHQSSVLAESQIRIKQTSGVQGMYLCATDSAEACKASGELALESGELETCSEGPRTLIFI